VLVCVNNSVIVFLFNNYNSNSMLGMVLCVVDFFFHVQNIS
jgi:hypothetical protein